MAAAAVAERPQEQGAEANKEGDGQKLSFKEHMWDRFDFIWTRRTGPSKQVLQDFVDCLQERSQVERQYAKGLLANATRLQAHTGQSGAIAGTMEAMMVNIRNRAEQSMRLAEELEQEVAATIAAALQQHDEVSKRVFQDGHRLTRDWLEARRIHDKLASAYARACVDAESAANQVTTSAAVRPTERTNLAARTLRNCRHATALEKEYHQAVHRLNAATELHGRQMSHVLDALETMEEKRALCFRDAVRKVVVYDISWLRNAQYDLDELAKLVEEVDILTDIQDFIQGNRTLSPPPAKACVQAYWELAAVQEALASNRSVGAADGEMVARFKDEVVQPLVTSLIGGKASEAVEALQAPLAELREHLSGAAEVAPAPAAERAPRPSSAAAYRAALGASLRAALKPPQALEDALPMQIPLGPFDALVSIFTAALDGCDREGDAFNGRELLVLSQKVQLAAEGTPTSIMLKIYSHPLWSRVTFWEDVLLIGIAEAHAKAALTRRTAGAGSEFSEVVMSPFLQRFVGYMQAMGIKVGEAHACVQKTLRKHQGILGPATEVYIDLLNRESTEAATKAAATSPAVVEPPPPAPAPSEVAPAPAPVTPPAAQPGVGAGTGLNDEDGEKE